MIFIPTERVFFSNHTLSSPHVSTRLHASPSDRGSNNLDKSDVTSELTDKINKFLRNVTHVMRSLLMINIYPAALLSIEEH